MVSCQVRANSMLSSQPRINAVAYGLLLKLRIVAALLTAAFNIPVIAAQTTDPTPTPAPAIVWEQLADGLEASHFQVSSSGLLASSAVAVRASNSSYVPRTIRASEYGWKKASAQMLCKASGAIACINSNFFDEQGKPLGVVISRGIQHNKVHNGGGTLTGVFFATSESVGVVHRSLFSAEKVLEAAQAGPRLISEGAPVVGVKDSASATNISLVCIEREKRVVLMRVSLAMFGGSLRELQTVLLRPELGCVEALNFDGGGSSQLYISGGVAGHEGATREEFLPGRDEVPVVLGLFQKR
jgi:hypothetical protein